MKRPICMAVLGPTASGKSSLALQIAPLLNGEIITMDSATIYQGFDIGTAKPTTEEQAKVPHHLIDILKPNDPFSAGHFVELAEEKMLEILGRGKTPIVVGGTYFYLRALQHGMYPIPVISEDVIDQIEKEFTDDETINSARMHAALKAKDAKAAENIHPNDRYRLLRALAILRTTNEKPSALKPKARTLEQSSRIWMKYSIAMSRHTLNHAITRRAEKMIAGGLVEETRKLKEAFPSARALSSIGYNETCQFLERKITEKQLRNEIIEKTRQLAKRQLTWLRSDPEIRYVDFRDLPRIQLEVENMTVALA